MKHEPAVRTHSPDDPPPTVIHHYEEDQTLLAKWLLRAMAKGATFWVLVVGVVVVVGLIGYFASGLMAGSTESSDAWRQLMLAGAVEDYQQIVENEPATPAGQWAALRVATSRYQDALKRLPADRDSAAPLLTQALDSYNAVADAKNVDPMLRRLALMGAARTLETRDELSEAITRYETVAKTWPDTVEGKAATERVKTLKSPEAIAFYKKFAAYKAPSAGSTTIGPRGRNAIDLPFGHPPLDVPAVPGLPQPAGVKPGAVDSKGELPRDVFQKPAPKDAPETPGNDALPSVFPKDEEKAKAPSAPAAPAPEPSQPK